MVSVFRPRWRKVLADLWSNPARTLLVVASVAVGVFAVGVIVGAYAMIAGDLRSSYSSANPANIVLLTDSFSADLVRSIRQEPGVADAEGRRDTSVRIRTPSGAWDVIKLTASADPGQERIDRLLPLAGSHAPRNREVVLEQKTLAKLDKAIGETIEVELDDGTIRELTIVGTVQELTAGYAGILGDMHGFIADDTLPWLGLPADMNRLYVTLGSQANDKAYVERMADDLGDRLENSGRRVYSTDVARRNQHPLASVIDALLAVLGFMGVLIVFLSGSLIANTMSALLAQHLRQIGVMKLVGGRRTQVIGMYLALIASFGLLALVIAIPLGSWGAYALADFAAGVINFPLAGYRIVPLALVLQVIVALLVPPVAGLLPVLNGSRITVQKAIGGTGMGSEKAGKGFVDRLLERIRWLPRPLLISLRNTFRHKARLALTLVTLTLGGAVFIAVFNSQVALNGTVAEITRYFRADVNLDLARSYRIDQVKAHALAVPGVTGVEVWASAGAEALRSAQPSKGIGIIAPPASSTLVTPVLLQGRWLQPGDRRAITVNEAFREDWPDLKTGDVLRLRIAGREDDWTVVGIFRYTGVKDLVAYANYEAIAPLVGDPNHASSFRIVTSEHTLAFQERVGKELETRLRDHGMRVSKIEAGQSLTASTGRLLGILTAVLLMMALLTALVGSIGLMGTMSMNVMERTREIGVLRAIGAHDRVIMSLVIVEGLVIGLISFAFGGVLSFPITAALSDIISRAIFGSPAAFALTPYGFAIWLAAVCLLSTVASLIPARNASRLTIREVLAYE